MTVRGCLAEQCNQLGQSGRCFIAACFKLDTVKPTRVCSLDLIHAQKKVINSSNQLRFFSVYLDMIYDSVLYLDMLHHTQSKELIDSFDCLWLHAWIATSSDRFTRYWSNTSRPSVWSIKSYCIVKIVSGTLLLIGVVIRYLHWPHIEVMYVTAYSSWKRWMRR